MKIKISHKYTQKIIYEVEAENIKQALERAIKSGADLSGADLSDADLSGADLSGVNSYCNNHDFLFELFRRVRQEEITKTEWEIIGKLTIHRFCWSWIRKQAKAPVLRMLKRLSNMGFDEYIKKYKNEI
jgi:hypothetical protein